jgi:hypothetical protein
MKYSLLVYVDPNGPTLSDEEQARVSAQYYDVNKAPGIIGGEQLAPVSMATTVRVDGGETLITDGPFADTKEVFGGFYLLEASNLDEAVEIASRVPSTWMGGSVEIRPLVERAA